MRKAGAPETLNELLGEEHDGKVTLQNLSSILGERMPELTFDRVGRLRLIHSLQNRFGDNYRQVPGVRGMLADFDKNMETNSIVKMNKGKFNG